MLRVFAPSVGWFPQLIGILWSTTSASAVLTMAIPSKAPMIERCLSSVRYPLLAFHDLSRESSASESKLLKPGVSLRTSARLIHPLFILYFFFASMHTGV
jgi:hypothetical protein